MIEKRLSALAEGVSASNLIGTGVDVVSLESFRRMWGSRGDSLRRVVFTPCELERMYAKHDHIRHLAGLFAAKEAVFKSLDLSWHEGAFAWTMIEITAQPNGSPKPKLSELAQQAADRKGVATLLVSIAYEHEIAVAVAHALT